MKNRTFNVFITPVLLALWILNAPHSTAFAQGTAFTYQGQLQNNGSLASGTYNLQFTLYPSATGGTSVAGPVTNSAVTITNGLFTATIDFGSSVWNGATNWLLIGVETNGGAAFFPLSPRQQVTPAPYAIAAENLSGTVSGAGLAGTYGNQVSFTNPTDQFTGSGSSLTGLNASQLTTGTVPSAALNNAWKTTGNTGTAPGANFIGTADNEPLELRVNNQRGLRLEPAGSNSVNVIGGWIGNGVASGAVGATVSGGGAGNYFGLIWSNQVASDFGTVSGGTVNSIQNGARYANIGGGWNNTIQSNAYSSAVGGGENNTIQAGAYESTVSGGYMDVIEANGQANTIGGGDDNTIEPGILDAVIGGGHVNLIQSNSWFSTIGGGSGNNIQTNNNNSTISGGGGNSIQTGASVSTIAGGDGNSIQASDTFAVIGGGLANVIQTIAVESTIAGGRQNTIGTNASDSVIGGGLANAILLDGGGSVIAGGYGNLIQPGANLLNGEFANISGGLSNSTSGYGIAIGGGVQNTANAFYATIGGGNANSSGGEYATVSGGDVNTASSAYDTVGGGGNNTASSPDGSATVSGGYQNIASGDSSTVPGGYLNTASGAYSFAAGDDAKATHQDSFVWGDGNGATSDSSVDQFVARASGGFYFYTGNGSGGAELPGGSGSWNSMSDRNAKNGFATVNPETVLASVAALPMTTWSYKTEHGIRHIGPMAQDFYTAFKVGEDNRHIAEVDEGGVALAAIQGLNQKLEEKDAQIAGMKQELNELKAEVKSLEQRN